MRALALVVALFAAMPALAAERVALVIGNADYKSAPLKNPINDARAMARRLSQLGFKVTKVENATRNQMERRLRPSSASCRPPRPGFSITQVTASRYGTATLWCRLTPI